jgi:branched-chain amino acid aminotransferase
MPAFLNNVFVTEEEAKLHNSDLSMQRGYAVFDFFRTVNTKPLFEEDHLNRFFHSANDMHLSVTKSREELKQIIDALIEQSQLKEAGIRLMLTGGYAADTYHLAEPNLLITCKPVKTSTQELFEKGSSAITYNHQRELPHIKSINYLMAVWLQPLLKEKGSDDVLYHHNGIVTEFPRANVFAVINHVLVTPASNILRGITRKYVLEQAGSFIKTEERDIKVEELYHASEIFLTSTTKRVIPVLRLNDVIVAKGTPGPVASALWEMFMKMEQNI